ncbi:hypothetical protein CHS0354_021639 [Potamilus streckersoni]|uniref:Uncharacterized protein n=1 Tax=Potamilus streckersoni TaxID=2493646 RepID=A0AAE0SPR2_9BIVA|nr:hypothetical protein CHS0354_021639 [Potamilus streckersoni]
MLVFDFIQDPTLSRIQSSEEEKSLKTRVLEAGGVPTTRVNPFWNDCANELNKHCGSSRTVFFNITDILFAPYDK